MTAGQTKPETPLLRMQGISKSFPSVQALKAVDFDIRAGEVHALMGENGAGKSTLIKVLTGVHHRDQGHVFLGGREIAPQAPIQAEQLGISTVFQEVHAIPHLSVAENIMLGRQPTRFGMLSWRETTRRAKAAAERINLQIDVQREFGTCSAATQQMVSIARAVDLDAKLLVLDEPTSSLDEQEVEALFRLIRQLRSEGLGILFVTHFLNQVYQIADRITVLRGGERVITAATQQLPRLQLIGKMLGKNPSEVAQLEQRHAPTSGTDGAHAIALSAKRLGRKGAIQPFDLQVSAGEVVGFAGLLGSGRTEAMRLLFGLDRATSGAIEVGEKQLDRLSPRIAIREGIAFCPEDRKLEGVILGLSVRENILLAMQASRGLAGALQLRQQQQLAEHYVGTLGIKTPSIETKVGTLSGGNQQKVLLARWLAMQPDIILLDEPTRGIDIGAKAEVESLIDSLREQGMAVLFVSSELDEVVRTCGRVAVMRDRQKIGELTGNQISENAIMEMIAQPHAMANAAANDQSSEENASA